MIVELRLRRKKFIDRKIGMNGMNWKSGRGKGWWSQWLLSNERETIPFSLYLTLPLPDLPLPNLTWCTVRVQTFSLPPTAWAVMSSYSSILHNVCFDAVNVGEGKQEKEKVKNVWEGGSHVHQVFTTIPFTQFTFLFTQMIANDRCSWMFIVWSSCDSRETSVKVLDG